MNLSQSGGGTALFFSREELAALRPSTDRREVERRLEELRG